MSVEDRSGYKSSARQLTEDKDLENHIEEFLISRKIQDDLDQRELVDQLTPQEETYLEYLEKNLKETQNRIVETQQLANNLSIRDMSELKKIEQLQNKVDELIEVKKKEQIEVIQRDVSEDVKEYLFRVVEENRKLRKEKNEFELKVLLRNKQIAILIREIGFLKKSEKNSLDKLQEEQKKKDEEGKRLINRVLLGVQGNTSDDSALKRIEIIEKNRKKNTPVLPKMKQYHNIVERDPFDFWVTAEQQENNINSSTAVAKNYGRNNSNRDGNNQTKQKSLKEVLPHQELWVIEQEIGQNKIDPKISQKTYIEAPNTLFQMPYRIQSSGSNNSNRQQEGQGQQEQNDWSQQQAMFVQEQQYSDGRNY